ncbi:hypothetical protein BH10PLA2_BH10PLA2_39660 [soil metagenome]
MAVCIRRSALVFFALAATALTSWSSARAVSSEACPFCNMQGQTLVGDINQASMVLYGTFTNAQLNGNNEGGGTTDLAIEAVIKNHEILGDKKKITLPRYIPPAEKGAKTKFLVFCDVFKGTIDPYRGVPVAADSDMVKYLQGAEACKNKSISDRLRFYFDYLDNKEPEISNDAYKEFGNSDYKDYKDMAKHLPPAKLVKWLEDPETPAFRYGLYASMLGHCGTAKDAPVLRKMLDDPAKRTGSGVDGVLAGYFMLDPKPGMQLLQNIMKDTQADFMYRYAALRATRFLWDADPSPEEHAKLTTAVETLLPQADIADLAIEDLRKWSQWKAADQIFGLKGQKSHDVPIIKRSILRYALSCPGPKAAQIVAEWRKADPETVKDMEELIKLEAPPTKA